jgi:hypothetical protein
MYNLSIHKNSNHIFAEDIDFSLNRKESQSLFQFIKFSLHGRIAMCELFDR